MEDIPDVYVWDTQPYSRQLGKKVNSIDYQTVNIFSFQSRGKLIQRSLATAGMHLLERVSSDSFTFEPGQVCVGCRCSTDRVLLFPERDESKASKTHYSLCVR